MDSSAPGRFESGLTLALASAFGCPPRGVAPSSSLILPKILLSWKGVPRNVQASWVRLPAPTKRFVRVLTGKNNPEPTRPPHAPYEPKNEANRRIET
jgi:hypothetical protein